MNRCLIVRHTKIFFRNKSFVFFALLSSLITIIINLIFIKSSYIEGLTMAGISEVDANIYITSWVFCGAIALNTFTVPISFMSIAVYDKENGISKDFNLSSISKPNLNTSYVISASLSSFLINIPVIIGLFLFQHNKKVIEIDFIQSFVILEIYILAIVFMSLLALMFAKFINNQASFGGFIGIATALSGFLGAIYMPIGTFNGIIRDIVSIMPITLLSFALKQKFISSIYIDNMAVLELNKHFGVVLQPYGYDISNMSILIGFAIGIVTLKIINDVVL